MFRILLLLMIVIPIIEVWGIIMVAHHIGGWTTFLIIILTGLYGAYLTKMEAKKVWHYAQHQLSIGIIPAVSILDGICIFAGGILLITPGFITDIAGFLLVLPSPRKYIRSWLLWLIRKIIETQRFKRL